MPCTQVTCIELMRKWCQTNTKTFDWHNCFEKHLVTWENNELRSTYFLKRPKNAPFQLFIISLSYQGPCFAIAVLLHFSLLATWGWSVIEAVSMYLLLVRVYNVSMRHFMTKATVCSYASAGLIVIASVIYSHVTASGTGLPLTENYTWVLKCF